MSRLAVLDDEESSLFLIESHLKQLGHIVQGYTSARDLLLAISREEEKSEGEDKGFDLIISDYRMPEMDGIEFIKRAKRIAPSVPIVIMTAFAQYDVAVKAIKEGAYDYLYKTLDNKEQFSLTINRALQYRSLERENEALKGQIQSPWGKEGIIGKGPAILEVFDLIERISHTSTNVLITGESGTGKEVIARAIHRKSPRANRPFLAINCSAIPESLLESELFGHTKGAFTGAIKEKKGLFEEANGGTLFLDEIGDMDTGLQAKLLRVLQEREVKPVGRNTPIKVDVRIIAASHQDLALEIEKGNFREDLYYRLNVIPIHVPALRERKEDIPLLANYFLKKYAALHGSTVEGLSEGAIQKLYNNYWRGNVRELENVIERAVVLNRGRLITEDNLPGSEGQAFAMGQRSAGSNMDEIVGKELLSLKDMEKKYVQYVLQKCDQDRDRASQVLGVSRRTLYRKLEGIDYDPLLEKGPESSDQSQEWQNVQ